jgi:hypothetical protein
MSANVFANGNEVSAKKNDNKSICAMPDVCLSPPTPPAGPVPIPYPNTSDASKTSDGSKTVQIGGDEVGLKNASNYKDSNGDEAATKTLGMGVISHTIQGKLKFAAWSMDVKIEGQNAIRHMDMTTHNHVNTTNGALVLSQAKEKRDKGEELNCEELDALNQEARQPRNQGGDVDDPNGLTLTTASRTQNGSSTFLKAATPITKIASDRTDGYEESVQQSTGKSSAQVVMCHQDEAYASERHKNHTEPKLMEPNWQAGGTIVMKIAWHPAGKTTSSAPCPSCKKACCIAEQCGLNVVLCNDDNQPVSAKEMCDGFEPKGQAAWDAAGFPDPQTIH